MPAEPGYVIIGASLAGAKAAETLREQGFSGPVTLIGAETERPYERPPLSKGYLLGRDARDSVFVHEPDWYPRNDVELRLGVTATAIDVASHQVRLSGGEPVRYDRLLITTGATPRHLDAPGADLDGLLYLRTLADSDRLGEALRRGGRVVIAGAGWIGLETAAAAREHGCEVTVVEPEPTPLYRAVGRELGEVFEGLHRDHGVRFRFGETVSELAGSGGQVAAVLTSAGAGLEADLVIAGLGVRPNVALAAEAGLDVSNGIVADEALRTSHPDIFAAGDVVSWYHPLLGRHIRVEHWANALSSGPAAARSMLGQPVSYGWVPYFFSDQYDLGMETAGVPEPGNYDRVIYRGDLAGREFIAFWLRGDVVVAGMNVNVWDVTDDIQALIRSGRPVDPVRLADPDVPLTGL